RQPDRARRAHRRRARVCRRRYSGARARRTPDGHLIASALLLWPSEDCQLFGEAPQAAVALVSPGIHQASLDTLAHGACRLTHVPAVEEPAAGGEARDLDEAKMPRVETVDGGR